MMADFAMGVLSVALNLMASVMCAAIAAAGAALLVFGFIGLWVGADLIRCWMRDRRWKA